MTGTYIALISVHGLIRGENLELGRDADTGGQTTYVVELAKALGRHPDVGRVDLFTRLVKDRDVSEDYSRETEQIADKVNIVRIRCGPEKYIRKEALWNYLDSFNDNMLRYFRKNKKLPDVIHSHYADAGYCGSVLSNLLGVPHIFTGHSLGREKLRKLMEKGQAYESINKRYRIRKRIEAEELALDTALFVVASTQQEISTQYSCYENYREKLMTVIPPGVDIARFSPPKFRRDAYRNPTFSMLSRFLTNPLKPFIFAMSRADERKNILSLIKAYGESERLQNMANLVIVAGGRDDIAAMDKSTAGVLNKILLAVDRYDLYGKAAYPKSHTSDEVPEFYRLCASMGGVFVNPALTEPFGLTLIEAAASGVPIAATADGGPIDIIKNCKNGILINPLDTADIENALFTILSDRDRYEKMSKNGIRNVRQKYTWDGHVKTYMKNISQLMKKRTVMNFYARSRVKLPTYEKLIITDIDNTLLGDEASLKRLLKTLEENKGRIGFGVATGRRLDSAVEALKEWDVPFPDFFITAVGSEIYYNKGEMKPDEGWRKHLNYFWNPDTVRELMKDIEGVEIQESVKQREFKVSYYYDKKCPKPSVLRKMFRQNGLRVKIFMSHGQYLDILPLRASKGLAVRYLSMKWGIEPENILVAGDSGNDEDMLKGNNKSVVVGNYSTELERLRGREDIYFAGAEYSEGILEGIKHFNFVEGGDYGQIR
ncbi:MAG: HAD-IIB family hydrolase [Deferribacterales bacterium]